MSSTPFRPSSIRAERSTGSVATCSTNFRRRVRPRLAQSLSVSRDDLLAYLTEPGEVIELWAWMASYDHVVLAQLWGDMRALPRVIPRFTHELRQRWEDAGCTSRRYRGAPAIDKHDALAGRPRHNLALRWQALGAAAAAGTVG